MFVAMDRDVANRQDVVDDGLLRREPRGVVKGVKAGKTTITVTSNPKLKWNSPFVS